MVPKILLQTHRPIIQTESHTHSPATRLDSDKYPHIELNPERIHPVAIHHMVRFEHKTTVANVGSLNSI